MKKLLLSLLVAVVLLPACQSDSDKHRIIVHRDKRDLVAPVKVELPEAIRKDPELAKAVTDAEEAINEISANIEILIQDNEDLLRKLADKQNKGQELSIGDALRAAKVGTSFMAKNSEALKTLSDLNKYIESRKDQNNITEAQIQAIEHVTNTFQKHMEKIQKKYDYLLKDI